jgi:hypothetical protein
MKGNGMSNIPKTIEEPARRTPVIDNVDVLVAGGGPAGIAAALAAAKEGARTLLVERYGYLGGMVTGANVVAVLGTGNGEETLVRGVTLEIRKRLEAFDAVKPLKFGDYRVDPEIFKWQAVEMLCEAGVDVLMHSLACEPILEDGRVAGVVLESKSGRQAVCATVTIDATADADLAARSGCPFDDQTHDITLGYLLEGVDAEKVAEFRESSPEQYEAVSEEIQARFSGVILEKKRKMKGVDVGDAAALTRAEIESRREYFGALALLRERVPGYENARITATRPQIGVRQGRRVRGQYVFTIDDLTSSRHFDDGIARMGCYLRGYGSNYRVKALNYDVPYRCLVPETTDGLLIAGRCVSCDYESCNTLRLIVPCFATGQAAGVAAALAARASCAVRDISVEELRSALRGQDVYLGSEE